MRALYVILPILGILTIAYRYYSAFIAAKVMVLDDARPTPAHVRPDGHNYHATTRWVLFGHHFAAIAGAGPLIGPVLAAQFGYAPGLIWLVGGVCLAGAVHDSIILWASTRRGGASLAEIARSEIGPVAGPTAAVALLIVGVIVVNPVLQMPAFSQFTGGGGPIVPGPLFPFAFITIACGAISGFHALIASGTTPKMIDRESDIRVIGYGAMLMEAVVGIVSIIAACAMAPGDYFAINTPPAVFAKLGIAVTNLPALEAAVRESVTGRTGGAGSAAIGMAQSLSGLPGMRHLVDYWYHFAIMFEALFILTTIDAGTRVAQVLEAEFLR